MGNGLWLQTGIAKSFVIIKVITMKLYQTAQADVDGVSIVFSRAFYISVVPRSFSEIKQEVPVKGVI